jgi:hypothetical protein
MLSAPDSTEIQLDSIEQALVQLIERVCPREKEEPLVAYQSFCRFAASSEQSITKLQVLRQQSPDAPSLEALKAWQQQYQWRKRLKTWNPIFTAYRQRAAQQREREFMERWNHQRQRLFEAADRLLTQAEVILKLPHVDKTIRSEIIASYAGQVIPTTTVIMAPRWKSSDIAGLRTALGLMQQVIGDRQIMIDRLHSDGFIITDPSGSDDNIQDYLTALERLEQIQEDSL